MSVEELPEYAERVLEVAELIPSGRVMTYGDVAEWLGEGGPRQVGRVMALYGGGVPWWRVVRADGTLLPGSELRALGHYRDEGTPLRQAGRSAEGHVPKLDMRRARWDGASAGDGGAHEVGGGAHEVGGGAHEVGGADGAGGAGLEPRAGTHT
ncbi:MGMT family protein [Streptomyces sp. NPDC012508]|uniref:MGMT family protein n=1 Tax=Streptomyces sp. NPDC012508 TaxID=3364837 RepID=UPI00367599B6